MRAPIPLTVESPAGRCDLLVDGSRYLADLLPALAAATGAGSDADAGWQVWEGHRRLDRSRSLTRSGVVPGSELRLVPDGVGPGP